MQTMNAGDNMKPVIDIYKKWLKSNPMDLEEKFLDVIESWDDQDSIDAIRKHSQANLSLILSVPLAIWTAGMDMEKAK